MMATGNASVFRLEDNDPTVRRYLNTAERRMVGAWQQPGTTWSLELHSGHLTGEPIYIRTDGNTDGGNVPKVDTRNHTANEYQEMGAIANYQKLRKELTETEIVALLTFIRTNWQSLSLIAHRYANNLTAPPDPQPRTPPPQRAATKPCNVPNCGGVVQNVTSGKAPCSICWKYQ
jgi:hypothetical protein